MSTSSEGRPGRYQRSAGGLVAALVITVVAVGGLLWVLGLFRPDTDIRPEEIDYLGDRGRGPGRRARPGLSGVAARGLDRDQVRGPPGTEPALELGLFTDDDEFVGIQQESATASELVREYVDEDATHDRHLLGAGSVAEAWQGYEDEGGDTAYAAEVGDQTVLVYGSASPEELQDLIGRLTRSRW